MGTQNSSVLLMFPSLPIGIIPSEVSLRNVPEVSSGADNLQLEPCDSLPPRVRSPLRDGNDSPNNNICSQWLAKTLPGSTQSNCRKNTTTIGKGVYVGVGFTLIPANLACRIHQGDFVDMRELLLDSWPL